MTLHDDNRRWIGRLKIRRGGGIGTASSQWGPIRHWERLRWHIRSIDRDEFWKSRSCWTQITSSLIPKRGSLQSDSISCSLFVINSRNWLLTFDVSSLVTRNLTNISYFSPQRNESAHLFRPENIDEIDLLMQSRTITLKHKNNNKKELSKKGKRFHSLLWFWVPSILTQDQSRPSMAC